MCYTLAVKARGVTCPEARALGLCFLLPTQQRRDYHLCNTAHSYVTEDKDLGVVIISEDMKAEKNVARNVKKADKILGMIRRTFSYMNKDMLQQLIKVFIRPLLSMLSKPGLLI